MVIKRSSTVPPPVPLHSQKWGGHVPLLDIWCRRLCINGWSSDKIDLNDLCILYQIFWHACHGLHYRQIKAKVRLTTLDNIDITGLEQFHKKSVYNLNCWLFTICVVYKDNEFHLSMVKGIPGHLCCVTWSLHLMEEFTWNFALEIIKWVTTAEKVFKVRGQTSRPVSNYTAWWQRHMCVCVCVCVRVNNLQDSLHATSWSRVQRFKHYGSKMRKCASTQVWKWLRILQNALIYRIMVPQTLSSYGDRTFAAAGPRLYNSLSVQLRNPDIIYDCSDDSWTYTFFGKHERGALWLLICGA